MRLKVQGSTVFSDKSRSFEDHPTAALGNKKIYTQFQLKIIV